MSLRPLVALALVAACAAGCSGAQRVVFGRSMTLARSECFGTCPDYTVTLHGDGSVVMRGGGWIVRPIKRRTRIRPSASRRLFALADSLRISELPTSLDKMCVGNVSDHPETRIVVQVGLGIHEVREQECATLWSEVYGLDSVVVRGVVVPEETYLASEEMRQWARANEDRFLRESLMRQPWFGLRPDGSRVAERMLARDSVARRVLDRFHSLARDIDESTGARAWADRNQRAWVRRLERERR